MPAELLTGGRVDKPDDHSFDGLQHCKIQFNSRIAESLIIRPLLQTVFGEPNGVGDVLECFEDLHSLFMYMARDLEYPVTWKGCMMLVREHTSNAIFNPPQSTEV